MEKFEQEGTGRYLSISVLLSNIGLQHSVTVLVLSYTVCAVELYFDFSVELIGFIQMRE